MKDNHKRKSHDNEEESTATTPIKKIKIKTGGQTLEVQTSENLTQPIAPKVTLKVGKGSVSLGSNNNNNNATTSVNISTPSRKTSKQSSSTPVTPASSKKKSNQVQNETIDEEENQTEEHDINGNGNSEKGVSTQLKSTFSTVIQALIKKDPHGYFLHPVTEDIAPNYFTHIKEPMDFKTMQKKNKDGLYNSFDELLYDFNLICENCMTYNDSSSVYYKEARKLLGLGKTIISTNRAKLNDNKSIGPITATPSQATLRERERKNQEPTTTAVSPSNIKTPTSKKELNKPSTPSPTTTATTPNKPTLKNKKQQEVKEEHAKLKAKHQQKQKEEAQEEQQQEEEEEEDGEQEEEEEEEESESESSSEDEDYVDKGRKPSKRAQANALLREQEAALLYQSQQLQIQQAQQQLIQQQKMLAYPQQQQQMIQQQLMSYPPSAINLRLTPLNDSLPKRKYVKFNGPEIQKNQHIPESLKTSYELTKAMSEESNILVVTDDVNQTSKPMIYNMYIPKNRTLQGSYEVISQNIIPNYLKIESKVQPQIVQQPIPTLVDLESQPTQLLIENHQQQQQQQSTKISIDQQLTENLNTQATTLTSQPTQILTQAENDIEMSDQQQQEQPKTYHNFVPNEEIVQEYKLNNPIQLNGISNYLAIKNPNSLNIKSNSKNNNNENIVNNNHNSKENSNSSINIPIKSVPENTRNYLNQQMNSLLKNGRFEMDQKLMSNIQQKQSRFINDLIKSDDIDIDPRSIDFNQLKDVSQDLLKSGLNIDFLQDLLNETNQQQQQQSINSTTSPNISSVVQVQTPPQGISMDIDQQSNTTTGDSEASSPTMTQSLHKQLRENLELLYKLQFLQYSSPQHQALPIELHIARNICQNIASIGTELPPSAFIKSKDSIRSAIIKSGLLYRSGRKVRSNFKLTKSSPSTTTTTTPAGMQVDSQI